jgi:hypothetical protein
MDPTDRQPSSLHLKSLPKYFQTGKMIFPNVIRNEKYILNIMKKLTFVHVASSSKGLE